MSFQIKKFNMNRIAAAVAMMLAAQGAHALEVGVGATADPQAMAAGDGAAATNVASTAIGNGAAALIDWATAVGHTAWASGYRSTSVGAGSWISGDYGVGIGQGANVSSLNAIGIGANTTSSHFNSIALGTGTSTQRADEVAIGGRTIGQVGFATDMDQAVNLGQVQMMVSSASAPVLDSMTGSFNVGSFFIAPPNLGNLVNGVPQNVDANGDPSGFDPLVTPEAMNVRLGSGAGASGFGLNDGYSNVDVGVLAGFSSTGSNNISLGFMAGGNRVGNNNVSLLADGAVGDGNVWMGIGAGCEPDGNNNCQPTNQTVAMGESAMVGADGAVAIGADSWAHSAGSVAIGRQAVAMSSVAIGDHSAATGTTTTAVGDYSWAAGNLSTAIGNQATALEINSVALGNGSIADRANTVSVGRVGAERQITNVADPTQGTDAVNLRTMMDAISRIGGGDPGLEQRMNARIDKIDKKAERLAAIAMAAGAPIIMGEAGGLSISLAGTGDTIAAAANYVYKTEGGNILGASLGWSGENFMWRGSVGIPINPSPIN